MGSKSLVILFTLLSTTACMTQEPVAVVNKNTLDYGKTSANPSYAMVYGTASATYREPAPLQRDAYANDEYAAQGFMPPRFIEEPSVQVAPLESVSVSSLEPIEAKTIAQPSTPFAPAPTIAAEPAQPKLLEPIETIARQDIAVQRQTQLMEAPTQAKADFIWPLQGNVISSFGPKENGLVNDGINISANEGEPIWATADGQVVYVGNELKGYGNMMIIRHDDGWMSAYAHAQRWTVAKGDRINQGSHIGYVGTSGNISEPQLHFGLRRDKTPVDPTTFLPQNFASN